MADKDAAERERRARLLTLDPKSSDASYKEKGGVSALRSMWAQGEAGKTTTPTKTSSAPSSAAAAASPGKPAKIVSSDTTAASSSSSTSTGTSTSTANAGVVSPASSAAASASTTGTVAITLPANAATLSVAATAEVLFGPTPRSARPASQKFFQAAHEAVQNARSAAAGGASSQVVEAVLHGRVAQLDADTLELAASGRKDMRVFLSSTFTDTCWERDIFAADAIPFLRQLARQLGVELHFSDMRWGINENMSQSHQTSDICLREVRRCLQSRLGINFVALSADKYGFRPLPASVDAVEFELLIDEISKQQSAERLTMLKQWYRRDDNALPAVYRLSPIGVVLPDALNDSDKALQSAANGIFWGKVFPTLQLTLAEAAQAVNARGQLSDAALLKYVISVTEDEQYHGIFHFTDSGKPCRAIMLHRAFEKLKVEDSAARRFTDILPSGDLDRPAQEQLHRVQQQRLPKALPRQLQHVYRVPWEAYGIDPRQSTVHAQYVAQLVEDLTEALANSLLQSWAEDGSRTFFAESDQLLHEQATHLQRLVTMANRFVGREDLVAHVKSTLATPAAAERKGPLLMLVKGADGSGRSSLVSKAVHQLCQAEAKGIYIARFIGRTAQSSSAELLFKDLLLLLHRAFGLVPPKSLDTWDDIKRHFRRALTDVPDGVHITLAFFEFDKLTSLVGVGNVVQCLEPLGLSERVRIVVTVQDTDTAYLPKLQKVVQSHSRAALLEMAPLSRAEAAFMLQTVLRRDFARQITTSQLQRVLDSLFATDTAAGGPAQQPAPLWPHHVHLLLTEVSRWLSFDESVDGQPLRHVGRPDELLDGLLNRLERDHSPVLVSYVAGLLCAAVEGLSVVELEDLLSSIDEVLLDCYAWWTPAIPRFPPLLLTRLLNDMSPLLSEREAQNGAALITWEHSLYREHVLKRYVNAPAFEAVARRKALHGALCDYFSGRYANGKPLVNSRSINSVAASLTADRQLPQQPWVFGRVHDRCTVINFRKLAEMVRHALLSDQLELAEAALCSLEYVEAKASAGSINNYLRECILYRAATSRAESGQGPTAAGPTVSAQAAGGSGGGSSGGSSGGSTSMAKVAPAVAGFSESMTAPTSRVDLAKSLVAENLTLLQQDPAAIYQLALQLPASSFMHQAVRAPGTPRPRQLLEWSVPQQFHMENVHDCVCSAICEPRALAFACGGRSLVAAVDKYLDVMATEEGLQHHLAGHTAVVTAAGAAAQGVIAVTGDAHGWLMSWDVTTGLDLAQRRVSEQPVLFVTVSADSRLAIYSAGEHQGHGELRPVDEMRIYAVDARTLAPLYQLAGHPTRCATAGALTADARYLLTASPREALLWLLPTLPAAQPSTRTSDAEPAVLPCAPFALNAHVTGPYGSFKIEACALTVTPQGLLRAAYGCEDMLAYVYELDPRAFSTPPPVELSGSAAHASAASAFQAHTWATDCLQQSGSQAARALAALKAFVDGEVAANGIVQGLVRKLYSGGLAELPAQAPGLVMRPSQTRLVQARRAVEQAKKVLQEATPDDVQYSRFVLNVQLCEAELAAQEAAAAQQAQVDMAGFSTMEEFLACFSVEQQGCWVTVKERGGAEAREVARIYDPLIYVAAGHFRQASCWLTPVYSLALAAGGDLLVTGGADHVCSVWRVPSGCRPDSYAISPSYPHQALLRQTLAAFGVDALQERLVQAVYDDQGYYGDVVGRRSEGSIGASVFPWAASTLAISLEDRTVVVREKGSGAEILRTLGTRLSSYKGHTREVRRLAVSPDEQLVCSSAVQLRVWQLASRKEERPEQPQGHTLTVSATTFTGLDDGSFLSASSDMTAARWDAQGHSTGVLDRNVEVFTSTDPYDPKKGHCAPISDLTVDTVRGLVLTAGRERAIKVWRLSDLALVGTVLVHSDAITSLSLLPNSPLVVSTQNNTGASVIWNLETALAENARLEAAMQAHNGPDAAAAATPTCQPDGQRLRQWVLDMGAHQLCKLFGDSSSYFHFRDTKLGFQERMKRNKWAKDTMTMRRPSYRTVEVRAKEAPHALVETFTDPVVATCVNTPSPIRAAVSPDGQLLAVPLTTGQVFVWRLDVVLQNLEAMTRYIATYEREQAGSSAAGAASDGSLTPLEALRSLQEWLYFNSAKHMAKYAKDEKTWDLLQLATNAEEMQRVLSVLDIGVAGETAPEGSAMMRRFRGVTAWSGCSRGVAYTVQVRGSSAAPLTLDEPLLYELSAHTDEVNSCAFASNSTLLSAADDGTIRVWDLGSGTVLQVLRSHSSRRITVLRPLPVSAPQSGLLHIASTGTDGTFRIWRAQSDGGWSCVGLYVASSETTAICGDSSGRLIGGDTASRLGQGTNGGGLFLLKWDVTSV